MSPGEPGQDVLLGLVAQITWERERVRDDLKRLAVARASAVAALKESGMSYNDIAFAVRDALLAAGWSPERVHGAGVSTHSLRKVKP